MCNIKFYTLKPNFSFFTAFCYFSHKHAHLLSDFLCHLSLPYSIHSASYLFILPMQKSTTHTCLHTYTVVHTKSYIHTVIYTHIHTYIRTYIHTRVRTYTHTCLRMNECMYTCMYVLCTYVHTHTHIRTYIHTYISTYIHTYIHTHVRTYVHTRATRSIDTSLLICFIVQLLWNSPK